MSGRIPLNGCDYLMLGFDHELRRQGYAGNSCQIILELPSRIPAASLKKRLSELCSRYPILAARPAGVFFPRWDLPASPGAVPAVREHDEAPGLEQRLCNEPMDVQHGELLRFDLVRRPGEKMSVVFTWAHALMDAPSAEYLLAVIGREDLPQPAETNGKANSGETRGLIERMKLAWKTLYRIDKMASAAPRSLRERLAPAPSQLRYRVEKFTAEETQTIRANSSKACGALGAAQFHAAAAMMELQRLHERCNRPSPSYVLPVPVGLRPKGAVEPVFSNQVTMLMTQFLPGDLASVDKAVLTLKNQLQDALRSNLLESGRVLGNLFRFLPLGIYMSVLKQGLRGEICSLFYGDTAAVNPHLTSFFGSPIEDFAHVAAITPSPGIGVIFYYFQGMLRVTVLHLLTVLTETEASEFAAALRRRLLHP